MLLRILHRKSNNYYYGLLTVWFLLVGCQPTRYSSSALQTDLKQSLIEAENAENYESWQSSAVNPFQIFNRLKTEKNPELQKYLCDFLINLKDKDLLVFKHSIMISGNDRLLGPCQYIIKNKYHQIAVKLDEEMKAKGFARFPYEGALNKLTYSLDDKTINNIKIDWGHYGVPKFDTEIQFRSFDPVKGYLAISGDVEEKQIVLTFDDGPSPEFTPLVLKALKDTGAKAMFFQCGNMVEYKEFLSNNRLIEVGKNLSKAVRDSGNIIGNHSYNHPYMGQIQDCKTDSCRNRWVSTQEAIKQIETTKNILEKALKIMVPYFRFPFGAHRPELDSYMIQNKISPFYWNMDSLDWKEAATELDVLNTALGSVDRNGKGIILFHDIHERTAKAFPQFLIELHKRGFTPVLLKVNE